MKKISDNIDIEASIKREASEFKIRKSLVALSGGPDSIATAFSLWKAGIEIKALHCNFHLRGEESNRDQEFVKEFCLKHQIPLECIEFDVDNYRLLNKGISIEMACRDLRHNGFQKQLKDYSFQRIATGHNADDNIETFFLNVLRGSGTRGLRCMDPDTGKIWRPLLSFHRSEILQYLSENNLDYVVDSTNLKSDFRRNFLRNEILPLFSKEWNGFDSAMIRTIRNINAENRIVEFYVNRIIENKTELNVEEILEFPSPLLLIKRFIDPLIPFTQTPEEVLSAIKANKPHIRKWRLKKGWVFLKNRVLFIEMGHGK